MGKIKITQVKSVIDRSQKQKRTMAALGLKKIRQTVEVEESPQVNGMIAKVSHLIKIEKAD
jgi:large subunit ribosomal protein L30